LGVTGASWNFRYLCYCGMGRGGCLEDGNPSIDTPRYTACWTLCSAHCVINSLILGWAGNGEKY